MIIFIWALCLILGLICSLLGLIFESTTLVASGCVLCITSIPLVPYL